MLAVDIPERVHVFIVESIDEVKHENDLAIINIQYDKQQPLEQTAKITKQLQILNNLLKVKPALTLNYIFNHGIMSEVMMNKKWFYLVLVDNTEDNKQWAFEYKKLLLNVFSAFKEDLLLLSVPVVDKEANQRLFDKEQRLFETFFKTSI